MVSVVLMIQYYYFGTIYLCMNILYYIGVQVSLPNISFTCHVAFIACTCDLPARALLMNMNQFNGFYGCSKCLQKGKIVKTDRGGNVLTFPYDVGNPIGPSRTNAQMCRHAKEAESGTPVSTMQ